MKILLFFLILTTNLCLAQSDYLIKMNYDKYCVVNSLKRNHLNLDSCQKENGLFEIDNTVIKHNDVSYIIENTELVDNVGLYLYTMSPDFRNFLFIITYDNFKNKVLYKSENIKNEFLKFEMYITTTSKVYIKIELKKS